MQPQLNLIKLYCGYWQTDLKFIWRDQRLRIAGTALKGKFEGLSLPTLRYHKATVIKLCGRDSSTNKLTEKNKPQINMVNLSLTKKQRQYMDESLKQNTKCLRKTRVLLLRRTDNRMEKLDRNQTTPNFQQGWTYIINDPWVIIY